MLPVNWMVKLCIFIVYSVNGEQYEPLSIVQQPIPVITRSKQTNGNNANHGDTSLSKNVYNSKNKQINDNLKVFNFPGKIGNNVYNKSLSQSTSKISPQHSPLVESSQSSATINHGELADNEESGGASPEDSTGSGDYDYRANDLPDWMPPPPPPPPVSVPPPPSRPTSSSFLSSSPSSLQLGSFPGRTPVYPLPTHTSLFHVLPRHGPFAHRPLEPGASHQKDEFTLFLVILTIAGFFGLIISMFMPFILLLQSQQQSLGSGLGGLQPVYPLQPGLVQPAQLGTGAVVANGKRRRRKRNDDPTVISIMASLHDATMKFRDS